MVRGWEGGTKEAFLIFLTVSNSIAEVLTPAALTMTVEIIGVGIAWCLVSIGLNSAGG
jgi:zinc transporter ZupT